MSTIYSAAGIVLSDHRDPEGRVVWICSTCGKQALWTKAWIWFGGDVEGPEAVYCCDDCKPDES